MTKNLIYVLTLFVFLDHLLAQEKYSIALPYEFPIKPGTQAWADLTSHAEMVAACEIPISLAQKMTTDTLLQTCLDYPLKGLETCDSGSSEFLDNYFRNFYGFKELAARKDSGQCLLDSYRLFSNKLLTNNTIEIADVTFVHWLYSRKEIDANFSVAQKEQLAILSLRNAIHLNKLPEYQGLSSFPAKFGLVLLVDHNITIRNNGAILDKSKLPAASLNYVNGESIDKVYRNWLPDFLHSVESMVK